jgi:hypothetical protein
LLGFAGRDLVLAEHSVGVIIGHGLPGGLIPQSPVSIIVASTPPWFSACPTAVHIWLAPQDTPRSTSCAALGFEPADAGTVLRRLAEVGLATGNDFH